MSGFTRSHTDIERINKIIIILSETYPDAKIALEYSNPWELLVSVILSAQCTDIMVNKVTAGLFRKYTSLESYVRANLQEFEEDIHKTGFFRNKAKHIVESAKRVKNEFGGIVPKTMEELLTLPGVARKTANVVLGNAYGVVEGIAVDTHVIRLSQRLRFVSLKYIGGKQHLSCNNNGTIVTDYIKDADPVKIENELMMQFPKKAWFTLTYMLIEHGRALCKAQNPKCSHCPVAVYCPVSRQ